MSLGFESRDMLSALAAKVLKPAGKQQVHPLASALVHASSAPSFASTSVENPAYDKAMRHSRRVRFLRRVIPLVCIGAVVLPITWGLVSPFAKSLPDVKVGRASISGSKITMDSPKLSGFKKDQKSYEVTAREAVQDIKSPTVIELNQLVARMEQERNSFARLTSDWGRFDQTADKLDLKGNVRVRTDSGYEVDMLSARVEMKSGNVVSTEPVKVRSQTGTIEADSVEVKDNATHVIFQGRVKSVFIQTDDLSSKVDGARKQ